MREILFLAEECEGGFVASAVGYGIITEARTVDELRFRLQSIVRRHFKKGPAPKSIRLSIVKEEIIPL